VVQLDRISVRFNDRYILHDCSLHLGESDRVGVVGLNGSGKTTLLKVLCGEIMPEEGEMHCSKHTTFGYLPQDITPMAGRELWDEVSSVFEEILSIEKEMKRIESDLASDRERAVEEELLSVYGELQRHFENSGGYAVEGKINTVLCGLGFSAGDYAKTVESFSGGWQMRIIMAKLLLANPDVLLLDEPTNNLDLDSIVWLESYLADYKGIVMIVSHDRYFLDHLVRRIVEIDSASLAEYRGNFTEYEVQRQKAEEIAEKKFRTQQEEIKRIEDFIERNRANKKKAQLVHSRILHLRKLKRLQAPKRKKTVTFQFPRPQRSGKKVISLKNVSKSYGSNGVLREVNLEVVRGEKIAIVGPNGTGKSTMMKIIAGERKPTKGECLWGHNVEIGYFAQDHMQKLSPEKTVLEEMESVAPLDMIPSLRSILGTFLFTGDEVFKRVKVLSGGEKSRLSIAKLLLSSPNLLLMDEPTNHLDITSQKVLEDALSSYRGTLILVSHDRYLLDRLVSKVIEISNHDIRIYHGNYSDYLWRKRQQTAEGAPPVHSVEGGEMPVTQNPVVQRRETYRRSREERREEERRKRKEDRRRASLEQEIERREDELKTLTGLMGRGDFYSDSVRVRRTVRRHRELQDELKVLYGEWEKIIEESEKE
jgi:ATP-binding cassette subfamily F protein 3